MIEDKERAQDLQVARNRMPGRRYTTEEKARAVQIAIPLLAQGISTRALQGITQVGWRTINRLVERHHGALQARLHHISRFCHIMPCVPERIIEARRVRARLRLTLYREIHGLPPIPVGRRRRADPLKAALATLRRLAAQGPQGSVVKEQRGDSA